MTRARAFVIAFLACVLIAAAAPVGSQESAPATGATTFMFDASRPISMAADRLEVDNKTQVARFIGNVVAVQDNVMMNADMVSVFYERTEKDDSEPATGTGISALTGGAGAIRSLVASGTVTMVQDERRASCGEVVFDQKAGTVTLSGNPVLSSGTDQLQGTKIVVHIDTERVEVIGTGEQRVRATVVPKNVRQEGLPEKAQDRLKSLTEKPLQEPTAVKPASRPSQSGWEWESKPND